MVTQFMKPVWNIQGFLTYCPDR